MSREAPRNLLELEDLESPAGWLPGIGGGRLPSAWRARRNRPVPDAFSGTKGPALRPFAYARQRHSTVLFQIERSRYYDGRWGSPDCFAVCPPTKSWNQRIFLPDRLRP